VQPEGTAPDVQFGELDPLDMIHPLELARGVAAPVQVYPMFESALRAQAGATAEEWRTHLGRLWSRFSEVAAANPDAWLRQAWSAEEVVEVSPDNRMIGAPYPKRLNSNNAVEQGAAVLLCSVEAAERLGVPRERWVFPWAGTDGYDTGHASTRRDFHSSPAIEVAGGRVLALAGVGPDDLAHVDLYSCFPSAVQLGAKELGLGLDRDLTVTGGLSFAGGPWNDYVTHSIATMARVLREDPGSVGLVTANGGLVQKHAFGVYSTTPPAEGFHSDKPQDEIDAAAGTPVVAAEPDWSGPGVVEAYTVMHDREGGPEKGIAAVATAAGTRTWATTTDGATMRSMLVDQWVGRAVEVAPDASFSG
jgi:acetyl-CoA C-acetyltransferase